MAIAYDNNTNGDLSPGVQLTFSHTAGALANLIVISIWTKGGDIITGVTYDGDALTLVDKQLASNSRMASVYYLANPSTGANDVVISTSASNNIRASAVTYTGADTSDPIDTSAKSTWTGLTNTMSITTGEDNVALQSANADNRAFSSAGTNTTFIGISGSMHNCRSTANIATAGATSLSYTQADTEPGGAYVIVSLKTQGAAPAGGATPAPTLLTLGVG